MVASKEAPSITRPKDQVLTGVQHLSFPECRGPPGLQNAWGFAVTVTVTQMSTRAAPAIRETSQLSQNRRESHCVRTKPHSEKK